MIDRQKAQLMRAYLDVALTGFEEHFGVAVDVDGVRFSETNAKIILSVSEISESGEVIYREAEDFKQYAHHYGLKPEWLGKNFTQAGKEFTISGLNTRAKKYKVLAVLAGHFHRELWHFEQDGTHHVIAPGLTLTRGELGWVIYDVYPDRVVQHFKPLWNAYTAEGTSEDHVVKGPLTFARHAGERVDK